MNRLRGINAAISMTEDYKPTDNAIAERVNGIIKQDWLYKMRRLRDLEDTREVMAGIIEFYNTKSPHINNSGMLPSQRYFLAL